MTFTGFLDQGQEDVDPIDRSPEVHIDDPLPVRKFHARHRGRNTNTRVVAQHVDLAVGLDGFIRQRLADIAGVAPQDTRLLYGGSVKAGNAAELFDLVRSGAINPVVAATLELSEARNDLLDASTRLQEIKQEAESA